MSVFDWINLGVGVVNLAANANTAGTLNQMRQQGATRELILSILQELRNIVFDSREKLKTLEPYLEEAPQAVYAIAQTIEWRFQELGITQRIFDDFHDKEYVQETLNKLSQIQRESMRRLSPEQIQQGQECAQALAEMPLLTEAIESRSIQEQIFQAEAELRQIDSEKPKSQKKTQGIIAIIAGSILCPVCFFGGSLIGAANANSSSTIVGLIAIVAMYLMPVISLIIIIFGIIQLVKGGSPPSSRQNELNNLRRTLLPKVPKPETLQEYYSTFGNKSSEELRNLLQQRQALVKVVLSGTDNDQKLFGN